MLFFRKLPFRVALFPFISPFGHLFSRSFVSRFCSLSTKPRILKLCGLIVAATLTLPVECEACRVYKKEEESQERKAARKTESFGQRPGPNFYFRRDITSVSSTLVVRPCMQHIRARESDSSSFRRVREREREGNARLTFLPRHARKDRASSPRGLTEEKTAQRLDR